MYNAISSRKMDKHEAIRDVMLMHFRDFGIFKAEKLTYFVNVRMAIIRQILADLEKEGVLVKGFFLKDDPTLYWMLKEDVDKQIQPLRNEMLLLNVQDNLHVYLRDYIRKETESATSVAIFKGTKIVGSFKGKLTISGAKVEDFKGSPEAKRYLKEVSVSLGVKIDANQRVQEDKDWDISEFYIRTNPGAI